MLASSSSQGILLLDKPAGKTSFFLVSLLRKRVHEKKIGHAGTLDPFATGVMVMLVGSRFTKKSDTFLNDDKEYEATLTLGLATDSFDIDGVPTHHSTHQPSMDSLIQVIQEFQGTIEQIPPMFSAKKVQGQKLYHLARAGKTIQRAPSVITLTTKLISYTYPEVRIHVSCSKGTYIRALAHDIGERLGCFAHLSTLRRVRSGKFLLKECLSPDIFLDPSLDLKPYLLEA